MSALLLRRCQSAIEKRTGEFQAPESRDRTIELGPREWLAVKAEASRNGWTIGDALATIIHGWLLARVKEDVRRRVEDEKLELAELQARNKRAEALIKGWRHEGQQEAREAGYAAGRLAGIAEMKALHAKRSREYYHRWKVPGFPLRLVRSKKLTKEAKSAGADVH
jgi:hypothetical protein